MTMIFKKLKLTNIRSYQHLEIEFPKGSILLSGDIGVGKTSILLALQFALFGLQPGQKGASILRNGESEASVSLEIELDGKTVVLERSLKKSKNQSITQEYNSLEINGEKKELSTSEMKNQVIELLDYPKEFVKKSNLLYKFTVYTPQEEMKAIIQERPEIRLDTLRHIFGIDRYKRIQENALIFLQKIKDSVKIKEVEIREINILKEKLTQETEKRIKLNKEINNLNIDYNNSLAQKNETEKKVKEAEKLILEKQKIESEISRKQIELKGKNEIKTRLEKEIFLMQKQIQDKVEFSFERLNQINLLVIKHKNLLEELNHKFLDISSKISVLESKKENALQLKEKIISLESCPTCFQSVAHEHKDKISKRTQFDLEEIQRYFDNYFEQKIQISKQIQEEKRLIEGYEKDRNSLEGDKIKFEHQKEIEIKIKSDSFALDRTINEIKEIEKQIIELNEKTKLFSESNKAFEQEKKNFDMINSLVRNIEISLAQITKESEILGKYLEQLTNEVAEKDKTRSQVIYLRQLQDWLEEKFLSIITLTEKNVMTKLRTEFSKIFSEWFSILVSDSLSVRLDEDFTPIITNQDYEIDYDFLSGGERTAVALAYRLALNQILNSLLSKIKTKDIVILDEPTDGFSEQQLDKMRDIFEQLKSEQIILVSHEQKIEGFVDSVIRIKKSGISSIESINKN